MDYSKTLLCVGECMVEMSSIGDASYRMGFAGDTFNTAWYARRHLAGDWSVGFASCIGTDTISDRMISFMQGAGIQTDAVRRLDDRTVGLYMIQLDNGERSFSYWRGQSAARALAANPDWMDQVFTGVEVVFFSGITLAILTDEARTAFCDALARARARGVQVVYDTNMRARLWSSPEAMCAGIMQGAAQADIVLPSFDEEAVFGDGSMQSVAARYHAAGASLVVVKNGPDDVLVSPKRQGQFTVSPPAVPKVVDTTAAGDSFNAGFLAAYLQGAELREAVPQGMELAARVIQVPGALVETP